MTRASGLLIRSVHNAPPASRATQGILSAGRRTPSAHSYTAPPAVPFVTHSPQSALLPTALGLTVGVGSRQHKDVSVPQELSQSQSLSNAVLFSSLFLVAAILALNPDWFDRPVLQGINRFTTNWQFANVLAWAFTYPTVE